MVASYRYSFIVEAIDKDLLYPRLAQKFDTTGAELLAEILQVDLQDDPNFRRRYVLTKSMFEQIKNDFGVIFDCGDAQVLLYRYENPPSPHLGHTDYEIPLFLEGRKKLGVIEFDLSDELFGYRRKALFDKLVAQGYLVQERIGDIVVDDDKPISNLFYYALREEAWRIESHKILSEAAIVAGSWNRYFECVESLLFGYQRDEVRWWLEHHFSDVDANGTRFCTRATVCQLGLIEKNGYRALADNGTPSIWLHRFELLGEEGAHQWLNEDSSWIALLEFSLPPRALAKLCDASKTGPWEIKAEHVSQINAALSSKITVKLLKAMSG